MDAELTACTGCGVALLDPELHATVCPGCQLIPVTRISDERRNGQIIDAFLSSIDCHAIDRAILDGTVDEPFDTKAVVGHLRGLLRG